MPTDRIYWDAACFISLLEADADRVGVLKALLEEAESGKLEIVTSIISLTEVAFTAAEKEGAMLSEDDERAIDGLLASGATVERIDLTESIARRARALMRDAIPLRQSLKAMDAIHLASAQFASVTEFQTYDQQLFRYGDILGFPIGVPSGVNLKLDLGRPPDSPSPHATSWVAC